MNKLRERIIPHQFVLIDLALILTAILMFFMTDMIVFFFHIIFVLLAIGAFFWKFRLFVLRASFWVILTTAMVLRAVLSGQTQSDELIEIPLLSLILMTVFFISSRREQAQIQLGKEHAALTRILDERNDAVIRLEALENDRQTHTKFLELLNEITGTALEADNLESTFNILVKQFAKLFEAQDCFFARWDETNAMTIPIIAYGSLSDIYPYMRFEPGERTLTSSLMEAEHPIALSDAENSPYVNPKVSSLFPSSSMLGLPLIVQGRKLGALILGYNKGRSFDTEEISRAETAANQIALVLLKAQLLEEERKQVKQLTALHDVALTSIQVDNEDELIERVTRII